MRVLSVVLIFVTLAIFGVVGDTVFTYCNVECPTGSDDSRVCLESDGVKVDSTRCEANNLIKCREASNTNDVKVTDGNCTNNWSDCEKYCGEFAPVCAVIPSHTHQFRNLCEYSKLTKPCGNSKKDFNYKIKFVGLGICEPRD